MEVRGLDVNRRKTLDARLRASLLLLDGVRRGLYNPSDWTARRPAQLPTIEWSKERAKTVHTCKLPKRKEKTISRRPRIRIKTAVAHIRFSKIACEQAEVLEAIKKGTTVDDASAMETADRILQVTGGPGTGKTEVIIAAAAAAAEDGHRVAGRHVPSQAPQYWQHHDGNHSTCFPSGQSQRCCLHTAGSAPEISSRGGYCPMISRKSAEIDMAKCKPFTFLSVTNKGAAELNLARLKLDYKDDAIQLERGEGLPAADDTKAVMKPGTCVRLTQNLDKDRGFVNGNSGVVEHVLRPDVFIVKTLQDIRLLVHPVSMNIMNGRTFLPVKYGYATTMRRAQGATLNLVGLYFDRKLPERGYAYVGTSRAKYRDDVTSMST
eukprot:6490264-Amphidinium_carterae.1